jgi:hypothetical protein
MIIEFYLSIDLTLKAVVEMMYCQDYYNKLLLIPAVGEIMLENEAKSLPFQPEPILISEKSELDQRKMVT